MRKAKSLAEALYQEWITIHASGAIEWPHIKHKEIKAIWQRMARRAHKYLGQRPVREPCDDCVGGPCTGTKII